MKRENYLKRIALKTLPKEARAKLPPPKVTPNGASTLKALPRKKKVSAYGLI